MRASAMPDKNGNIVVTISAADITAAVLSDHVTGQIESKLNEMISRATEPCVKDAVRERIIEVLRGVDDKEIVARLETAIALSLKEIAIKMVKSRT